MFRPSDQLIADVVEGEVEIVAAQQRNGRDGEAALADQPFQTGCAARNPVWVVPPVQDRDGSWLGSFPSAEEVDIAGSRVHEFDTDTSRPKAIGNARLKARPSVALPDRTTARLHQRVGEGGNMLPVSHYRRLSLTPTLEFQKRHSSRIQLLGKAQGASRFPRTTFADWFSVAGTQQHASPFSRQYQAERVISKGQV